MVTEQEAAGTRAAESANEIVKALGIGDMDGATSDPAELASRLEAMGDGEKAGEATTDDKGSESPQGASSSTTTESTTDDGKGKGEGEGEAKPAADEKSSTGEPVGVLLKDGKHFIPYDEHRKLREAKNAAEERVRELEAQSKGAGETGKDPKADPEKPTHEDDLAAVNELEEFAAAHDARAEAYEVEGLTELANTTRDSAKSMRATANALKRIAERTHAIGGYVDSVKTREAQAQRQAELDTKSAVEEAIDNNPKLRFLRDTESPLWDLVADQDQLLRRNEQFANLPLTERFARAVSMVEAAQGKPIELPAQYQSVADIKRDAAGKVQQAGSFRPSTLSDLPGGGVPSDTANEFSNMDNTQLARLMMDASPEKLNEMLAKAG